MRKSLLWILLFQMVICGFISAQTVTQDWATLPSGSLAEFITCDTLGNVYAANGPINTVSKITPDGITDANWAILPVNSFPVGIAIDEQGNVYTANNTSSTVSKITPDGALIADWAVLETDAQPYSIVIDKQGNVYTGNVGNLTISKITPDGTVTERWLTFVSTFPFTITMDRFGNIFAADNILNSVTKITPDGTLIEHWADLGEVSPLGIVTDSSGNVYTSNNIGTSVCKITADGTVISNWASLPEIYSYGICIDSKGNLYVGLESSDKVCKITPDGTSIADWAILTPNAQPHSVIADKFGNVFTSNVNLRTISKISTDDPLPTKLKNFTGLSRNRLATLKWETALETDLDHFELQQSTDGISYTKVAHILPNGSSAHYQVTVSQTAALNYYRLRFIDKNNHTTYYSPVLSLSDKDELSFKVFPNPAKDYIYVQVVNNGFVRIFDSAGKLVKTQAAVKGMNTVDISILNSGSYFLEINGETRRFVK